MEERVKATNKTKKKTYGGYYSIVPKWDVRGKSSKELKIIVQDCRLCITHQLTRIKKIKYVLELYKQRDVTHKLLKEKQHRQKLADDKIALRNTINRRENKIEKLDSELDELEQEIKSKDREIAKLSREIEKTQDTLQEVRSQKRRGYTKTVKETLSKEAKRLEKIADGGVDEKTLNNLEYLTRTYKFIKDKGLTFDQLTTIVQAEIMGDIRTADLLNKSYKILEQLTQKGYLQSNNGLGAKKYWFVTLTGKELIKNYKNMLSYGKSILTEKI